MNKKLLAVCLTFFMLFCTQSISFASQINEITRVTLEQRNQLLLKYLSGTDGNKDNIGEKVSTFLRSNNFEVIDSNSNGPICVLNKVNIDDNNQVTFYSDGTLGVTTISSGPNKKSNVNGASFKLAEANHSAYGLVGNLLYTIHVENNFGYDGIKAWAAGGFCAYHQNGCCSLWQIDNWETGTTVINNGEYCRAFARGNFHYGFEYEKIGIVIQDVFEDLRVSVTRNGDVYRSGE